MDIKEYVLTEIFPLAKERVMRNIGTGDILIGQMPYFEQSKRRSIEMQMKEAALDVARELESRFEKEMKEEYLNLATLKLLTDPFTAAKEDNSNVLDERRIAEARVKDASEKYVVAFEAVSYLQTL